MSAKKTAQPTARKPAPAPVKPRYAPHPMLGADEKAKAKLAADTGRSWDDWVRLARTKGPKDQEDLTMWLRKEHGHRSMTAWWIASAATGRDVVDYEAPESLVDALYSGAKAALRPVHEKVVDAVLACGDEALVTSCKTMVPCYRKHVFAELRPGDGCVEVKLALGDAAPGGRLQIAPDRMPGDRLSHRVVVRSAKDVDTELKGWLAKAYEFGAGKIARAAGDAKAPADFAAAMKASKKAAATWETCTPAMRRDFVQWIEQAKQAETRARRVERSVSRLAEGHRKAY